MGIVVIGLFKNMNNLIGFWGEVLLIYKEKLLEVYFFIEIVMWDERLSIMVVEWSLLEVDVLR